MLHDDQDPCANVPLNGASPTAQAIRAEIQKLLEPETFGVAELTRIADIANAGKSLLQATDPNIDNTLLGRARQQNGNFTLGGQYGTLPVAGSNTFETYGATVLRNLVPALTKPKESLVGVIKALAAAREEGLDDVAAALKKKLAEMTAASGQDVEVELERQDDPAGPPTPTVQGQPGFGDGGSAPVIVSGGGGPLPSLPLSSLGDATQGGGQP